jgi:hypothetical protein
VLRSRRGGGGLSERGVVATHTRARAVRPYIGATRPCRAHRTRSVHCGGADRPDRPHCAELSHRDPYACVGSCYSECTSISHATHTKCRHTRRTLAAMRTTRRHAPCRTHRAVPHAPCRTHRARRARRASRSCRWSTATLRTKPSWVPPPTTRAPRRSMPGSAAQPLAQGVTAVPRWIDGHAAFHALLQHS